MSLVYRSLNPFVNPETPCIVYTAYPSILIISAYSYTNTDNSQMFYASLIMYNGALMAIKLAFLAQYYRIMTREGALKRALIIISCIIGLWTT